MKTRLNLATAPFENNRRFIAGAALAGTIALLFLAWLSLDVYRTWHRNRSERAEIARLQKEIQQRRAERRALEMFFNSAQTKQVMDRAGFLNSLIEQRSFPWTKIFMDLERTLPEGVRVISIAPRMENGSVELRLVVGAASDDGKLKFLRALESSPEFTKIEVRAENRPNRPGATDQVELELVAWYVTS